MSKKLVVGNWKMNLSHKASLEVVIALKKLSKKESIGIDVVLCPSFTSLSEVSSLLSKSRKFQLGAQNVHWDEKGAWTGQVAANQITPFVRWCLVGHSEVRALNGDTDEQIQVKTNLLLKHGITPIVCVGETAEEQISNQGMSRISYQVRVLLSKMTRISLSKLVIAYEPVWAIGTGETPDSNDVAGTLLLIRKLAAERFGNEAAERLRVIYGGSVNEDNAADFASQPGVDGVLVGTASTHPMKFLKIIKAVQDII